MNELFEKIPGYREAVEQEQLDRAVAFLDLPETLCGLTVKPFTLAHQNALACIGSPFVLGGNVTRLDVRAFFLIVSEARGFARWWLKWRLRKLDLKTACAAIRHYLDRAEMDAPAPSGVEGPCYWAGIASYVDFFGSVYSWPEQQTLHVPKSRLHQYLNVQRKQANPKLILFNPSDKVRTAWLRTNQPAPAERN